MSVTIDSILIQDKEFAAADLDGCVVVLSVQLGSYFGFNCVGSEIWNMLSKPCRVGEIFDSLAQSHDVDATTLCRDVIPFLQTLIDERLARLVDPGDLR